MSGPLSGPSSHGKYRYYCGKINAIYQRFTDLVEPFSIDEPWLDVTASQSLFGNGKQIADTIRETVKEELNMTLSAGVSFNKIFAKMGSEYKKPDATTVISRENFREILWPLAAGELFGVGRATSEKLYRLGIKTIGDIAASSRDYLTSIFGKTGGLMWDHANGLDESPVAPLRQQRARKVHRQRHHFQPQPGVRQRHLNSGQGPVGQCGRRLRKQCSRPTA